LLQHHTFLTFFFCSLCVCCWKWAECQVRLHKRHARLLMNYSFTIRYMYVYVRHPVCCRLLKYSAHKIKKGRRWRKRNDFVMSDDNFSSCHFNSIKLLNVLVVIVKWSDNRFSFFFFASKHSGRVREKVSELYFLQWWTMCKLYIIIAKSRNVVRNEIKMSMYFCPITFYL
jgi:hypothetical protein